MKILGIDYGDARIGLAACDVTETLASPLKTIAPKSMRLAVDYLAAYVKEIGAGAIVVGMPLNMDGTEGERASKTRAFGRVLGRVTGLTVSYQDERLTTIEAEEVLKECAVRREKRKELIDTVSAQIILQSYLDFKKTNKGS